MYFANGFKVVKIFVFCAVLVSISSAAPDGTRLEGGQDVDTLRQFSHHVYIVSSNRKCAGSILNEHWIITSAGCTKGSVRLDLYFGKQHEHDLTGDYYSISVHNNQIYPYPTGYDDIALIKIPLRLVFSDTISPVALSNQSIEGLRSRFAVMPGFNEKSNATPAIGSDDNLKYGMFKILDNSACKTLFGYSKFDEYTQLCAEGWGSNQNTPCDSDVGGGLVVGWPSKTELIGLFSVYSPSCDSNTPTVYTYIAKYMPWIESMIYG